MPIRIVNNAPILLRSRMTWSVRTVHHGENPQRVKYLCELVVLKSDGNWDMK
jgi:hypothetical protein